MNISNQLIPTPHNDQQLEVIINRMNNSYTDEFKFNVSSKRSNKLRDCVCGYLGFKGGYQTLLSYWEQNKNSPIESFETQNDYVENCVAVFDGQECVGVISKEISIFFNEAVLDKLSLFSFSKKLTTATLTERQVKNVVRAKVAGDWFPLSFKGIVLGYSTGQVESMLFNAVLYRASLELNTQERLLAEAAFPRSEREEHALSWVDCIRHQIGKTLHSDELGNLLQNEDEPLLHTGYIHLFLSEETEKSSFHDTLWPMLKPEMKESGLEKMLNSFMGSEFSTIAIPFDQIEVHERELTLTLENKKLTLSANIHDNMLRIDGLYQFYGVATIELNKACHIQRFETDEDGHKTDHDLKPLPLRRASWELSESESVASLSMSLDGEAWEKLPFEHLESSSTPTWQHDENRGDITTHFEIGLKTI